MTDRLLILGWHNADPTPFFPSAPRAAARGLWRQLGAIRRLGNVVPLEDALAALAEGRPLPARAVALTFDDGYRDNLDTVAPMLRRLGLPATFYLVPGLMDRTARPWWETIAWAFTHATRPSLVWRDRVVPSGTGADARAALGAVAEDVKRVDRAARDALVDAVVEGLAPVGSEADVAGLFLDWEGARGLSRSATIGSHSSYHAILSEESAEAQAADLDESRRRIARELEVPVETIAYPNGTERDYDAGTLAAADAAGYRGAVTTRPGWNDAGTPRHELRRFVLDPARGLEGLRPVVRAPGALTFARGS